MELDKTVRMLKNSLLHVEKIIPCQLEAIFARHPNAEDCLENIISELKSKNYFEQKGEEELRKLHFLLLLNTNLGLKNELECNVDVGHIVGAVPQLNPYLYFMLSYEFSLLKFLPELIEWGPTSLTTEILVMLNSEIKCLPLPCYFEVLANALNAIFSIFVKTDGELISKNLLDYFQILLLHYKDDDKFTQKNLVNRKRNGYKWLSLIKLLSSMTECFFNSKVNKEPVELYSIKLPPNSEDKLIPKSNLIEKCYAKIFSKCRDFGECLDIEMFMAWHEVEYDDEKTLQSIIGEEAYHARTLLEPYKNSGRLPDDTSQLIAMLQSVQKKTETNQLQVKKLSKSELEQKMLEDADFNSNFVKIVEDFLKENTEQFSFVVARTFIHNICSKNFESEETDVDVAKNVILLLLQSMEFEKFISFVEEFIYKYGLEHILYEPKINSLSLSEQIISFQDDESEEDYNILKDVSLLALRSTYNVQKAFIRCGCAENDTQLKIVKLLNMLRALCLYRTRISSSSVELPLLIFILKDFLLNDYQQLSVAERRNFQNLVLELSGNDLIDNNLFFHECLFSAFNATESSDRQGTADLLTLLTECVSNFHLKIDFPLHNLLILLAQILDSARWSMTTFSSENLKICEECITAIELLLQMHSSSLTLDEVENELLRHLDKFSEFTKFYFHNICPSIIRNTLKSMLVSLIHKPLIKRDEFLKKFNEYEDAFILRMAEILPLCTFKEMERIIKNYSNEECDQYPFILDLMTNAISLISNCAPQYAVISVSDSNEIFNCLGQTINNFLTILQKSNVTCRKANVNFNCIKYVNRIAAVLKAFPPHLLHTYEFNLIKFISEFFENTEFITDNSKASDGRNLDEDTRQLLVGLLYL